MRRARRECPPSPPYRACSTRSLANYGDGGTKKRNGEIRTRWFLIRLLRMVCGKAAGRLRPRGVLLVGTSGWYVEGMSD